MPASSRALRPVCLLAAALHAATITGAAAAPAFPVLADLTAISLPESASETGTPFSIVRPAETKGAFNASISCFAAYPFDQNNPAPRPPLKYRFSPADAWTAINWSLDWATPTNIPFTALENERVIYLAASDDNSWDPTSKPGKLWVKHSENIHLTTGPQLQFPDNDPPPVFVMEIVNPVPRPPIPGIPDLLPGIFEGYPEDGIFFSIRADRPVSEHMYYSISVNAAQSTATPNVDFSARPADLLIVEAGLTGFNYSSYAVSLTDDQLIESDEIMAFNITSTTAGVAYSSVAAITLKDNDFYQTSIADASVLEGNAGTILLTFPITISQARPADVTFDWVAASGTAVSPSDFTAASGTVTIPAGAAGTTIQIEVNGDTLVEANGTFALTLSNPSASDVRLADAAAVGTITNDDFPSVSMASATVSEAAGSITLTATLSEAAPFAASVVYTLVNGTAIRSSDYTGTVAGTLNFPAGSTTATLSLTILNDTTDEPDETFSVQLGNPSGLTLGTSTASITMVDNDAPVLRTPPVVNLVEGDSGSQTIPVTLTLNTPAILAGSVDWQVASGSSGVEAASGTVTFPPGATTASLSLTLPGNLVPHPVRSVKLQLRNPVEVSFPLTEITVATITDNDQRELTGNAVSLAEGNAGTTIALFPVSISAPLEVPVTVQYRTADGSALAGSDYTAANGTATIPAGATEVTIPITVPADTILELTETFSLLLSSPVNATLATAILTGTIQNDDAQPVLQVSPSTVTSGPGGPFPAWIEIKLPEASSSLGFPVAYAVATRNGTALAGTDYTAITGGVITFPPGNGTPASLWITVAVAGNQNPGGGPTQFHVDFTPLTGPVSILSTDVKIEPLRVTAFSRIGPGFYTVSFPTGIAQNYVIQQATSLAGPWSDKTSVIPGTGNPVDEFLLFASQPRAYFRVRSFTTPPATPAIPGRKP